MGFLEYLLLVVPVMALAIWQLWSVRRPRSSHSAGARHPDHEHRPHDL